ncbi:NUDIX domain-containing protein [Kitasatospora sp. NPDC054939]
MRDTCLLELPPPRRLYGLVLLRNGRGQLLLLNPAYLDGMILPGGPAHADEPPHLAAARSLHAQTGLHRRPATLLAVDYSPADRYRERLSLVFDGGIATDAEIGRMTLAPPSKSGLLGAHFVDPAGLDRAVSPAQAARIREGLARAAAPLPLLLHGQRAA